MVDTTVPTSIRVFTKDTADGKGIFVQLAPNGLEPMVASPFFNSLQDFDITVILPTKGA